MRRTKLTEHISIALFALVMSYLAVAALDRFFETSALVRAGLLLVSLAVSVYVVPRALNRWFFRHRNLREVAREVTLRDAVVGDRLLGVFELSNDDQEFQRSPELVRAAIAQGERDLGGRDLSSALPVSRHKRALGFLAVPAAAALTFAVTLPAVAGNAFKRWAMPFADVERYTFARLDGLDSDWVVPIQEESRVALRLSDSTESRPKTATLRIGGTSVAAALAESGDSYELVLPPLAGDQTALLVVGDVREAISLQPRERPEVVAADVAVALPSYLEISEPLQRDVRGGSLSVVEGASVALSLGVSRALESVDARLVPVVDIAATEAATPSTEPTALDATVEEATITLPSVNPASGANVQVGWVDSIGLAGHSDFGLSVRTRPDEAPVVALSGVDAETVLLQSVPLTFDVLSSDDFGVRRAGLEWRALDRFGKPAETALGEKVINAGAPDADILQSFATFRPTDFKLRSGFYELRGWAEDALPGRERSFSMPIRVRVMTPAEHMEWVTTSYDRWMQRAVEVRDREMELLAENKELHALTNEELDQPDARTRLENQSRAERSNRARLQSLAGQGQELLNEAMRNPEFGSNVLDDMAEANAALKEIADTRMDSVAKLLQSAARSEKSDAPKSDAPKEPATGKNPAGGAAMAKKSSSGGESSEGQEPSDSKMASAEGKPSEGKSDSKSKDPKIIGKNRGQSGSSGEEGEKPEGEEDEVPPPPMIMDGESTVAQAEVESAEKKPAESGPPAKPSLGLVETTLGPAPPGEDDGESEEESEAEPAEEPPSKTKEEVALAIAAQEALLEEFNKVAGDIEDVLASLENSTFVKRLKAASRAHGESATELDVSVSSGFGSIVATSDEDVALATLAVAERRDVQIPKLTDLHGDLDAYFDRLQSRSSSDVPKFERVLDEWNDMRPTLLSDSLVDEAEGGRPGDARASADFLSDTFDRWGEELVGPG